VVEYLAFFLYRAAFDEQQAVMTQLEEDRFVAMKRTQRLEEELSAQKKVS
jgi:hypothetical protein